MPPPKEPRYPVYLPPHQVSSSAPHPRGHLSQMLLNKPSKPSHRPILPSAPLRSPPTASSKFASERTPLLVAPKLPRQVPLPAPPRSLRQPPPLALNGAPKQRRRSSLAAPKPIPDVKQKKPFYRPRPLWLVPFAIIGALVRGMTLAPRVEVYTQLACYSLHAPSEPVNLNILEWDASSAISLYSSLDPLGPHLIPASPDPRTLPSHRCLTDPAVQASAARLQTLMTTTMGILSALTTTFWGRFSQSHGRTKVLAISTFGLFFTDLIFILASTPSLPWPLSAISYNAAWDRHKHHVLIIGPIVEGLLGGWSTLQSTTSAYISDCTSVGSRAGVFSRFTGVFYLGFSVGPMIAGWIVRHPEVFPWFSSNIGSNFSRKVQAQSVTAVFWVAIICSFVNFLLVLFVFPESLDKEKQRAAAAANIKGKGRSDDSQAALSSPVIMANVEDVEGVGGGDGFVDMEELRSPISPSKARNPSIRINRTSPSPSPSPPPPSAPAASSSLLGGLLRPLAVFLPVFVDMPTRNGLTLKRRRDWSLTLLAMGLAGWMLSTGVYQIKYLYAEHVFGWGANELSWYISWLGAVRAVVLLGGIPWVIEKWKPKPGQGTKAASSVGDDDAEDGHADMVDGERDEDDFAKISKPAPTRLELGKSIRFDLRLARVSLFIDLVSNILIAATPSPSFHSSLKYYLSGRGYDTKAPVGNSLGAFGSDSLKGQVPPTMSHAQSQALFVLASSLSAFGGGLVPAVHSLALCIVQARGLEADFGITGYGLRDADIRDGDLPEGDVHGYGAVGEWDRESTARGSSTGSGPGQSRGSGIHRRSYPTPASATPTVDSGTLFGAFAVLQALGQMILGPTLFGLAYSATVSKYPKMVFIISSSLLMVSMILLLVVKNPVGEVRVERREKRFRKRMMKENARIEFAKARKAKIAAAVAAARHNNNAAAGTTNRGPSGSGSKSANIKVNAAAIKARERRWEEDIERRGRSSASKDLRGGAVLFGSWVGEAEGQRGEQETLVVRSF